jgi:galactokinase
MIFKASAPGRLDVMGGISDYSGALVLQMPLLETTEVEVEESRDEILRIESGHGDQSLGRCEIPLSEFLNACRNGEDFRALLKSKTNGNWAIYPAACLAVLVNHKGLVLTQGLHFRIRSSVPLGKGVSSSAAIEVATIRALAIWKGLSFEGTELAVLAQQAENQFVGAPCGLMDQLASGFGERGSLLPILCQPDVLFPPLGIPEGIRFFGLDSGVKHEVVGASYADVRTATSMGYSILAQHLGAAPSELRKAKESGHKSGLPFGGHLANIPVSKFNQDLIRRLPEKMTGKEFVSQFSETADPYARISPETEYSIRTCTKHPVEENLRTKQFRLFLQNYGLPESPKEEIASMLGELMFLSHASYSLCGLGHPRTDELVEMVRGSLGKGVFGAKITGGGSGGTVCVFSVGDEGKETVKRIHSEYSHKYEKKFLLIDPNRGA